MSKHAKYVPKHRDAPQRPVRQSSLKLVRSTVLMSSVAVAATGAAVSGGVLGSSNGVSTAAQDLGGTTTLDGPQATGGKHVRREPVLSRSSDRRGAADTQKALALSAASGPAVTQKVDIADQDPRDIARALLPKFGFGSDQFGCLDSLWTRESGWNIHADNPSSSAYGIPQALPGSKMSSAGSDWATNPVTQITWGLGYIKDRYGSPCGAWGHSESHGFY